jgi:hypothetical protein
MTFWLDSVDLHGPFHFSTLEIGHYQPHRSDVISGSFVSSLLSSIDFV